MARARDPETGRFVPSERTTGDRPVWVEEKRWYISLARKGRYNGPGKRYTRCAYPLLFPTKQAAWEFAEFIDVFAHPYVDEQGAEHTRRGRHGSKRLVSYTVEPTWVWVRREPEAIEEAA